WSALLLFPAAIANTAKVPARITLAVVIALPLMPTACETACRSGILCASSRMRVIKISTGYLSRTTTRPRASKKRSIATLLPFSACRQLLRDERAPPDCHKPATHQRGASPAEGRRHAPPTDGPPGLR